MKKRRPQPSEGLLDALFAFVEAYDGTVTATTATIHEKLEALVKAREALRDRGLIG